MCMELTPLMSTPLTLFPSRCVGVEGEDLLAALAVVIDMDWVLLPNAFV